MLLGNDPGLVPLKQLVHAQGNPFFLEESVRALVETALGGERALIGSRPPAEPAGASDGAGGAGGAH